MASVKFYMRQKFTRSPAGTAALMEFTYGGRNVTGARMIYKPGSHCLEETRTLLGVVKIDFFFTGKIDRTISFNYSEFSRPAFRMMRRSPARLQRKQSTRAKNSGGKKSRTDFFSSFLPSFRSEHLCACWKLKMN